MKRVIIIGASYAGLSCIKHLQKNRNIEILLFDKIDYHYIQVESYNFVSSKSSLFDVTVNIGTYIKSLNSNIKFYNKEITSFNSISKEVITAKDEKYSYDYLVIATGALTNFPIQVPNIEKYSIGIKTIQSASKVKQTFDSIISKVISKKRDNKNKAYNIVIGGAGLSGVEVACEMAAYLRTEFTSINEDFSKINIIIIDGMKTVLPNMDERLINACNKRLKELNIKTYLGSFIKDVDENKIYLSNNTVIDYDYFVFTGGIKAVTIDSNKKYEVNKLNQYIVNGNLKLKNEKDIFVIGDAAQIISDDKYFAPTAQLAIQTGRYVSKYIKNDLAYRYTENFDPKLNGVLISLGGNYGVGLVLNKLFIKGYIAFLLKNFVTYMHKMKFSMK